MPTGDGPKDVLQIELLVFLILSNTDFQKECITWPDRCSYWFEVHPYLVLLSTHLQPGGRTPLLLTTYTCYSLMCEEQWSRLIRVPTQHCDG